MTDYPDWTVPQANANAISITGTPLLTLANSIGTFNVSVPAGSTVNIGEFVVTQPSYEISISTQESGAGTFLPMTCEMLWFDAGGTVILAEEQWYFWPGTTGNPHVVVGKGPTKGAMVSVTLTNQSTVGTYTAFGAIYQRSHIYTRDVWQSQSYPTTMSTNPLAPADPTSLLLAGIAVSINAGATNTYELPLWSGQVFINAGTASNTNDLALIVKSSTNPNAGGLGQRTVRALADATGTINLLAAFGRSQNEISLQNTNAAAKAVVCAIYAVDVGC